MHNKNFLTAIAILLSSEIMCVAQVRFAEFEPFGGNRTTVSGELDSNPFMLAINNPSSGYFFNGSESVFNNSSNLFNNPTVFTPATTNLDYLRGDKPLSNSENASVMLSFDEPVTNLSFFVNSFEDFAWDLSGTVPFVTAINGNNQFQVIDAIVRDTTGNNNGGTASGTLQVIGTFETINIEWQNLSSDLDEFQVQFFVDSSIGDVNCDSDVNLLDIEPFVDILINGPYESKADVNRDGKVNLLDVAPFVDLLSG